MSSFIPPYTEFGYLPPEFQIPEDDKQLREFIAQRERMTADLLNAKTAGQYETFSEALNSSDDKAEGYGETVTAERWFSEGDNIKKRDCFRKVINFGALPNSGVKTVAHHIKMDDGTNILVTQMVDIRAVAWDPTIGGELAIPLPYVDPAGNNVAISLDKTNVIITTSSNRSNYTKCYVVLEYLRT
jgi:hypothetical protein